MQRLIFCGCGALLGICSTVALAPAVAQTTVLPVPCSAGTCGPSAVWITSGQAAAALTPGTLTVSQTSDSAILNWQSFNISSDGTVIFQQPDAASIAVNRIHEATAPSAIFGALEANGRVFLINRNGIVFGEGAQVNVGGLAASTLNITDEALQLGLAGALGTSNRPAFERFADPSTEDSQDRLVSGSILVERGARIETPEGGQVLMFAPQIENRGTIRTPGGQTILGAGNTVYLASSTDDNLRGLLIEVDAEGDVASAVTNGEAGAALDDLESTIGQIVAERGNVTLAGLAVNQLGRVSATTSVRQNGSIRLQARQGFGQGGAAAEMRGTAGGSLVLGPRSVTEIALDEAANETTVDANAQPQSRVVMVGGRVELLEDSRVTAPGGAIAIKANEAQDTTSFRLDPDDAGAAPDASRIYVARGATLDVSGASVELPMERNVLRVELRGNQLRDSPIQRDGALRGKAVFVDVRESGTREDGTTWVGTPLADVSGDISTIARSVAERNTVGGGVMLQSQGDVVMAPGATVDVSGGGISYRDGVIKTTQLLGENGLVYDIAAADPNRRYVGPTSVFTREHPRWGVTETFAGFPGLSSGRPEPGYVEGADAGSVTIVTPRAILDGDVVGEVTGGRYQRQPAAPLAADQLRRPYTQLPRGARLELGRVRDGAPEFLLDRLRFGSAPTLGALLNDAGLPFDVRRDSLPASLDSLTLREDLFGRNRVAEATLVSSASIVLDAGQALSLADGGSLDLIAPSIDINGTISAVSGNISATAALTQTAAEDTKTALRVGSLARIVASGQWVNDDPRVNAGSASFAPLYIHGGGVSLTARQGDLILDRGGVIDVSAGAYRDADAQINAGRGGEISLGATPVTAFNVERGVPTRLLLGAELRGYALSEGGALRVAASAICVATADCSIGDEMTLHFAPERFVTGGFSSFDLRSNRDGLTVAEGTQVTLRQQNLQLLGDTSLRPSGADIFGFSRPDFLPDLVRRPVDLALGVAARAPTAGYGDESFRTAPGLAIGMGVMLEGDTSAEISLGSNTRIAIDGTVNAPAGRVSAELDVSLPVSEFLDAQTIRLGERGTVDVGGVARVAPNANGQRAGQVLDGGQVVLNAVRGYVALQPGSLIDVSGTAADVDVVVSGKSGQFTATRIGSSAGSIEIAAAEGAFLNGLLEGRAGGGSAIAGRRPAGGGLSVVLDPAGRNDPSGSLPSLFPIGERAVLVTQAPQQLVLGPDSAVPSDLNGRALVVANTLMSGGFDSMSLAARPTAGRDLVNLPVSVAGRIAFDGDVDLALAGRLTLDAGRLDVGNGRATLAAPYVRIGQSPTNTPVPRSSPATGSGVLTLRGDFIEVLGHSVVDRAAVTTFESTGDLRLRGAQQPEGGLAGSLLTAGHLTLASDQVYASTLSSFEIGIQEATDGVLTIEGNSGERSDVLSAASTLRLTAPRIEQRGTLRAPFGTIDLEADELVVATGSLTSTSAEGSLIPFGTTQGGFDWVYQLEGGAGNLVYGAGERSVPGKQILFRAGLVDVQPAAVIDLSGGGDLLAYEFVPGVGGSRDILAADSGTGELAIVPSLNVDVAPFDQREYRGAGLLPGDNIYLEGAPGLPPGEYVLLPARYALLPGAYLVRPVDGYVDLPAGEQLTRLDGATIVSGYRTLGGAPIAASRRSGFVVRPAALARRDALYTTVGANEFFARQAADREVAATRLPRDAGVLGITTLRSLALAGDLRAASAEGGRRAAVDISSSRLRVAASPFTANEGEVVLDAQSLSRLDAESLLLGGRRVTTEQGVRLEVSADTVTIAQDAVLAAPELLMVANDKVAIESGGAVEGTGTAAADAYLLAGDAAFLRVSGGEQATVAHADGVGARGTVEVAAGARIAAVGGSVLIDASLDTILDGDLGISGGSLNLGASRISLGDAGIDAAGSVLTTDDLARLGLEELVLTSGGMVDLTGNVRLDLNRLVIDAAGLSGSAGTDFSVNVAETVRLTNTSGRVAQSGAPEGVLNIAARNIEIGEGTFLLGGFARATLAAVNDLVLEDHSDLRASGNLELLAARLTALAGSRAAIAADGELHLARSATTPAAAVDALGARVSLSGSRIRHDGAIDLPAGNVSLHADGAAPDDSVVLGAGSVIDVSGRTRTFDGVGVSAGGGRVELASDAGDVQVGAGATIDVRGAADGGDAGAIAVTASQGNVGFAGSLLGNANGGSRGGSLEIDAEQFGGYAAIARHLDQGGFTDTVRLRQRGVGNLEIGPLDTLRARNIELVLEQGAIRVAGTIDAGGATGGRVRLAARDDVIVDGTIDASATNDDARGGVVELMSDAHGVRVNAGAAIDVAGGAAAVGGTVHVRVPRTTLLALLDGDGANDQVTLGGDIAGARRVTVEGFRAYEDADGVLTALEVDDTDTNPAHADAAAFMAGAPAIRLALGRGEDETFRLLPGVEIFSNGDLTLGSAWNLFDWRFANDTLPGILTLRAAGNLVFGASLSDGFVGLGNPLTAGNRGFLLDVNAPQESWSYRLIGGADMASSDPLAVRAAAEIGSGGNVEVGSGTAAAPRLVRTGTGSIEIAAANDFTLGNQLSAVYTAGLAGPGVEFGNLATTLFRRAYPIDGGDISISAGQNVVGARTNQLFTDWLWRVGSSQTGAQNSAVAWTINFARFQQNVGALGGGDVRVTAGEDIRELAVSIPSIGRQVGGQAFDESVVEMVGGGNLDVSAGGSILGGSYYVDRGAGTIRAGDAVGRFERTDGTSSFAPIVGLGDSSMSVTARANLAIESIANPTLLPISLGQGNRRTHFSSYSDDASVRLASLAGDILLDDNSDTLFLAFNSVSVPTAADVLAARVAAPTLRAAALSGDVILDNVTLLYPAPKGNLELFAHENVRRADGPGNVLVALTDTDVDVLPTIARPTSPEQLQLLTRDVGAASRDGINAPVPVHADENQPDGLPDTQVARVVAASGDVDLTARGLGDNSSLYFAKPVRIVAGRDLIDVPLVAQNLRDGDTTGLFAGRDLRYTVGRTQIGTLQSNTRSVTVDGPGLLQIGAGRNLDLQASRGIVTRSNLDNLVLPEGGADISILAGLGEAAPQYSVFIERYLNVAATQQLGTTPLDQGVERADYSDELVAYVRQTTGTSNVSPAEALEIFSDFDVTRQRPLIEHLLIAELRASGRAAAESGKNDFSRGFEALETLFPGSNPDVDAGEINPYEGDVRLYFSRVYTLAGGDISIIAPGGEINAGLAVPPEAFGFDREDKGPSDLGIVVQQTGDVTALSYRDFQVNESRVFAADGGNILVWSTNGDIDAGRGAKTAISAPPPTVTIDPNGRVRVLFPAALTGSGIQTLATSPGTKPGNVDLFAPRGVVNAGDAGIVAGNLTIAATAVLGADNIQVSGVAVGVPVDTGGFAAALTGVSAVASSATSAAEDTVAASRENQQSATPLAEAALGFLDVFVTGFGDGGAGDAACDPNAEDCASGQ